MKDKNSSWLSSPEGIIAIVFTVIVVISFSGLLLLNHVVKKGVEYAKQEENRTEYVSSCYILKPKNKHYAYLYNDKNGMSKAKKVSEVIIPAKLSVGNTNYEGYSRANPFRNNNVSLNNDLTISSDLAYPVKKNSGFIQVLPLNNLHQYTNSRLDLTFVAPTNSKYEFLNRKKFKTSSNLEYLNLAEFNIKHEKLYNISTAKNAVCFGYAGSPN